MSALTIQFNHFALDSDANEREPVWASLVERWYQLDRPAFALAEAYSQFRETLGEARPELLLLASPGASNSTDADFVRSGSSSAAKFVHTLPNVRGTSLYQIMSWSGPMLCVQNGSRTILSALSEVMDEYFHHPREIWLFSAAWDGNVYLFRLSPHVTGQLRVERSFTNGTACGKIDSDLVDWLSLPKKQTFVWQDASWERRIYAPSF